MLVSTGMRPLHYFIIVFKLIKVFYDIALIELGSHDANQTLFVALNRDYTQNNSMEGQGSAIIK